MSLLPVYTVSSFSLPYIYSTLLNNLIYNRRKSKFPPQFKFFARGTADGDISFFFSQDESPKFPFIPRQKHSSV